MNKEQLLKNIASKLSITDSEKEYTFRILIEKVTEKISFDEALKIDGLGVFQLQKEPMPRQERTGLLPSAPREKRTLIYSPPFENVEGNINSVFLTIDLDDLNIFPTEDVNRKFSISVNQPLIPISENESIENKDNEFKSINNQHDLEEEISEIVNGGILLQNYDIWEDYLNRNTEIDDDSEFDLRNEIETNFSDESSNGILSGKRIDSSEESDVVEEILEPLMPDKSKIKLDDDIKAFEQMAELEKKQTKDKPVEQSIFPKDEVDKKNNINEHDKFDDTLVDFPDTNYLSIENLKRELNVSDDILENDIDSNKSRNQESEEQKESPNIIDEMNSNFNLNAQNSSKKSLFDELEKYLKDDNVSLTNSELLHENNNPQEDEMAEEFETLDSGIKGENQEQKGNMEEDQLPPEVTVNEKPFYAKMWFIISGVLLILIIITIFIINPFKTETKQQVPVVKENKSVTKTEEADTEVKPAPVEEIKQDAEQTGLYRKLTNDMQVSPQIYSDGTNFTVQVSSWKSTTIAENEVAKLKKLGYDAFIFQVFLESKNSTWNRVRIGYFNSMKEAQDFLIKNKL